MNTLSKCMSICIFSLNIFYSINAQYIYIYIIQTLYTYKGLERKHIYAYRVLFLVKVVFLTFSRFGFKGMRLILIVSGPSHCSSSEEQIFDDI